MACNATGHSNVKFRIDKMKKREKNSEHTQTLACGMGNSNSYTN